MAMQEGQDSTKGSWVNAVITIRIPMGMAPGEDDYVKQEDSSDLAARIADHLPADLKWSISGTHETVDHEGNPTDH